ncbi:hypothetical protein [Actinokineospora fastidiosa]|nr:hypothetical protein [Actinokineospora fastidiosa]
MALLLLPAAEQEAASWARDQVLIADEIRFGHEDGVVHCWLTGRGHDYLAALRYGASSRVLDRSGGERR